ncbi:MAG: ComEC/Rec2 family competence protein, partial [Desulfobacteraceae bacterium]|nr:ComEC/Rec2 family competence protein [Desulfobacteraceae bacterium]
MKKREITLNPPLAIPALLYALGIIAGSIIVSYYVFSVLIILLYLFLFYKKKNNFKFSLFLFIFVLGFISILPFLPKNFKTKPISKYFGQKDLQIFGRVDSKPKKENIRTKFILKISKIKRNKDNKAEELSESIRLYSYRDTPELQVGDLISFKGTIKKPRNFSNPGGFDYVRYLSFNKIAGISYTNGKKIKIYDQDREHNFSTKLTRKTNQLRDDFSTFIKNSTDNDKAFSILCALTTGVKTYIPDRLRDDFSKTGASHILAISGLHLSIITGIFFFIFNTLFLCIRPLAIRGFSGKFAAMATLVPLILYAFLSGFSPSTKRAFIMISIYMFSYVIDREKDVFNSLAAAGIIILVIDPCAVFAISFQLSFAAVFFIILGIYVTRDIPLFM